MWLSTKQTRNLLSLLLRKGPWKSVAALYNCPFAEPWKPGNGVYKLIFFSCCFSYSILLFCWQRWHSSYKPKQQLLLFKEVERYNSKIKIWQRNNERSFYAQTSPYSWYTSYCHLIITGYLTDHHLVWMNRNVFLCNEMFSVFLYFTDNSISYWFMFTIFNINFLKRHFYLCYKKISLHAASITHAQECFARTREKEKKFIKGCGVLRSFKH